MWCNTKLLSSLCSSFIPGNLSYYFNASVVLSGMTNEEHLEAALVFAQITETTGENKYEELCVDFLNLLYLRGYLSEDLINNPAVLKVISENKRWKTIYQKVS